MYDEFAVGMTFPRAEDVDRLGRYKQAGFIYNGVHQDSEKARRLDEKLRELNPAVTQYSNIVTGEGVVYLVYNLPRLVCDKFADLQVLQTPIVLMESDAEQEAFRERLLNDIPDFWARWHTALSIKRGYGDVLVTIMQGRDRGPIDMRVVKPDRWFPVLDPSDHLTVLAHQIAWVEEHEIGRKVKPVLRVDICRPDVVERKAFYIDKSDKPNRLSEIKKELSPQEMQNLWPGIRLSDTANLGGLMPATHLRNGQRDPSSIFGCPQFEDSGSLIDDISWRLGTWSDVNDKISHPPRVVPNQYLEQDKDGTVYAPSRYVQVYAQKNRSGDPGEMPRYMVIENFDHETLEKQFIQSVLAFLIRNEMSPALLGLQFGNEKESGEAKSLGMGTTEAATRRDLLQSQPCADRALTGLARLSGNSRAAVSTHWRIGLPKTQAQLLEELETKKRLGLVTKRDMLEQLYPFMREHQIDKKLEELQAEDDAELQRTSPEFAFQA